MPDTRRKRLERGEVDVLVGATVRFCGDSGDGMQVVGAQFTRASARMGNAVSSLPDYPSEIRAPAGTLAGVSGFQVHFSAQALAVPVDRLTALVAMNPAALRANIPDLEPNGVLLVNQDAFRSDELLKAGYSSNPLEDGTLSDYRVLAIPMVQLSREAVAKLNLTPREADRCRNFFSLGIMCWLFERDLDPIRQWIMARFATNPAAQKGNLTALQAGFRFAETEVSLPRFRVPAGKLPQGAYRHITGNEALVLGLEAAARQTKRKLIFACSPMTPASDLLHVLQLKPHSEVQALQAEDDAAAAAIALGAAFGGAIGVAAASGSGLSQMSEVLSLAVMTELPLVIFVIQRGGPSTGLPTKVEQADLNLAMYGRNGECPLPVLAAATPGDCFHRAHEAIHIACRYMTPVIVLSDVYLAGGAEAWRLPAVESLAEAAWPDMPPATAYLPYQRDALGVRPWATPGMPGYEHRIGGLEKEDGTGNVNYEPLNHERMTRLRSRRITEIAASLPLLTIDDPDGAELLVLGWGSTQAAISGAVQQARSSGHKVAQAHLGHLHPLPTNTGELLRRYQRVIVPELNHGQLRRLLRSELMIDAIGLSKVQGRPFQVSEIAAALMRYSKSNAKT